MSGRSNEEVATIIDNEGLGYAVLDYLGPDDIADPKLRKLWAKARDAMEAVVEYLRDELNDE